MTSSHSNLMPTLIKSLAKCIKNIKFTQPLQIKSKNPTMFFVAFDQVQRNEQSQYMSFHRRLTFSFKLLFLVSLGFVIHNMITLNGFLFANIPTRTFLLMEFWRIFTAPYGTIDGLYGPISLLIAFWWLLSLFPGYERKYSSIHLLLEICSQNFLMQICYGVVVQLLIRNTYFIETYNDYFFSLGWMPIIIIWIFKFTGENKEEKINFCFLPLLVKNKYLAWIISFVMIVLTMQRTPLIVAAIVGAVQFHLFHRSWFRIPMWMHVCFEKPFLLCARCSNSFVRLDAVRHNLEPLLGIKEQHLLHEQSGNEGVEERQKADFFNNHDSSGKDNYEKKESQIEMANQQKIGHQSQESGQQQDLN